MESWDPGRSSANNRKQPGQGKGTPLGTWGTEENLGSLLVGWEAGFKIQSGSSPEFQPLLGTGKRTSIRRTQGGLTSAFTSPTHSASTLCVSRLHGLPPLSLGRAVEISALGPRCFPCLPCPLLPVPTYLWKTSPILVLH